MAAVTISGVFPCGTAPFSNGQYRLWTEENIRKIFNFIFDGTNENYCVISNDNKTMVFNGYLFNSDTGFILNKTYYIILNPNGELYATMDGTSLSVLYDEEPTLPGDEYTKIEAISKNIKFVQTSIGNIDLNN